MAEEIDLERGATGGGGDPAAIALALGQSGTLDPRAAAFLEKQSRLADLQIENLQKQDEFELSHLRWRRFSDQMKGALQIVLVLAGVAVLIACGAAVWNASRAEGLVVDTVSVPPEFAQAGMSGEVIADDLTNKIAAVRDTANENSITHSADVKKERDEDIKVEIPDTGVSLGEASRYLRSWLGHERHLSGNLRNLGNGRIALTVALDGADAVTFAGAADDLDKLEQQAAEHVFQSVDPSNYTMYLASVGRESELMPAVEHLIRVADSAGMLTEGYTLRALLARDSAGDFPLEMKLLRLAAAIDPKALPPHMVMMFSLDDHGHDEGALREARLIPSFRQQDQYAWREGEGFAQVLAEAAIIADVDTGDFIHASSASCGKCSLSRMLLGRAEYAARLHDTAKSRALTGEALAMEGVSAEEANRARYFADWAAADWKAAAADARAYGAAIKPGNAWLTAQRVSTQTAPLLAYALARAGDFADAYAEIDQTPGDCVACETARGDVDAFQNNEGGATYWFSRAVYDAPSIPFAYTDWGAMLLQEGKHEAAIAKFKLANQKGPHFADPLEMWGEALMQKNRSDLALAKFEEANKYAPNWGRLHMKWGEALGYVGRKDEARSQYRIVSTLDVSVADWAELARDKRG